eukprot:GILI01005207.1.p1 GENE.GILI01005207.1~~GILI01005207.1.p1  ORF type:complete len:662 (-),score=77.18 GILI01005207.1:75-1955(-)
MSTTVSFDVPVSDMAEDYAKQTHCGPLALKPDMRSKHQALQLKVKADLPIKDPFKRSDCDTLYRYLIANAWDVEVAAAAIRENNLWRERCNINTILAQKIEEDWGDMPQYMGVGRDGCPLMYTTPNTTVIGKLVKTKPKDVLMFRHYISMERARYLCKKHNADRVTSVLDLTHLTMGGIASVITYLKDTSEIDQKYYPDGINRILVCNAGWAVQSMWKGVKNIVDTATQNKITVVSGPPSRKSLLEFCEIQQIPRKFGGEGDLLQISENFTAVADRLLKLNPLEPISPLVITRCTVPRIEVPRSPGLATFSRKSSLRSAMLHPRSATRPQRSFFDGESPRLRDEVGLSDTRSFSQSFYSVASTDNESEFEDNDSGLLIQSPPKKHTKKDRSHKRGVSFEPSSTLSSRSNVNFKSYPVRKGSSQRDSSSEAPSHRQPKETAIEKIARVASGFTICLGHTDGTYTASVDGQLVGRKMGSVILHGTSDALLMSIEQEAGHYAHTQPVLVTPKQQANYVLRKSLFKSEITVMDIVGNRSVLHESNGNASCPGEKILRYTISCFPNSKDNDDWLLSRKGTGQCCEGEEFLMWKQGRMVEVSEKMLTEGNTPDTIVALALSLATLWYYPLEC